MPEHEWKIDLEHLKSQIKPNTKAILVNNPSNPCGSCFTKEHMEEILAIADEFLKYSLGGGKVLKGLVNRRKDERAMYLM